MFIKTVSLKSVLAYCGLQDILKVNKTQKILSTC
jgi:hypothetical protein